MAATPEGLTYGTMGKHGRFDGVLGYIQQKKADIFVAPSAPNILRHGYFDYHAPFESQKIHLLTLKPDTFVDPWGFVRAFEPTVWYMTLATLLFLSLSSVVLHRCDRTLLDHVTDEPIRRVSAYLWFWFARIFPQPDFTPPRTWLRLCAICFMLPVSLMFMNALEADLKGNLVFKKEVDHVNYFGDILRFRNMKLLAEPSSAFTFLFSRSRDPFKKKLATRLEERAGTISGQKLDSIVDEIVNLKAVVVVSDLGGKSAITILAQRNGRCPRIKISAGSAADLVLSIPIGLHLSKRIRERIQSA
ncbi:hypothetical protein BIW11_03994 [Tropilaelaps mercedesae]|uniref:Uncharacterized protein n=1 Tax=Tropilaelaps mercedesae TaxID=418985 RepID=A0A1V9XD79_9ACAR|nr:hypothetical protein BIW11_03994 [Tropilaelaps mercedesae]